MSFFHKHQPLFTLREKICVYDLQTRTQTVKKNALQWVVFFWWWRAPSKKIQCVRLAVLDAWQLAANSPAPVSVQVR